METNKRTKTGITSNTRKPRTADEICKEIRRRSRSLQRLHEKKMEQDRKSIFSFLYSLTFRVWL
jgi:chorismate synthase